MKVYGYARVSTQKQSIERQIRNIMKYNPEAVIYQEKATGRKMDKATRPELNKLLKRVKSGDVIVFDSVSRMARNADEGVDLYMKLYGNGVKLVFLNERHIDSETYQQTADMMMNTSINTGDTMTDSFVKSILDAVNLYIKALADRQIRLAFDQAQKEVDDLRERTKQGIETARINGKQIGAIPEKKRNIPKRAAAVEIIKQHSRDFLGDLTDEQVMKLAGISRNTFYKYKRELAQEIA